MEVNINHKSIKIFQGAKVKDVLRKYSMEDYNAVHRGEKIIVTNLSHPISLEGELIGGENLKIEEDK
ncbi:MAG: hypothetical protein KAX49_10285 [Halanaerobiales bacterium]|nr:hypothetical protein [Halanaerobiales bacterium]